MEEDLSPQRFELVLKLCDMLSIEDFTVAALMLKQCNWNIERALGIQDTAHSQSKQQPQKKVKPQPSQQPTPQKPVFQAQRPSQQPAGKKQNSEEAKIIQEAPKQSKVQQDKQNVGFHYDEDQQLAYEYTLEDYYQQQAQQQYYKREQQRYLEFENKKKNFNLGFVSMPLVKTKSQVADSRDNTEKELILDKQICQNYSKHRFDYQNNLLDKSSILCQKILSSKSPEMRRIYDGIKRNENNKQFLTYLHKKYNSKINFTFGTFLLNLARSYLDGKYLLVYIHKSCFQDNDYVKTLLNQIKIAKFINKNCVSYGMFDSSDDYQILQKYVPMKDLPNFVLFKFNKKDMKQQFINAYPVIHYEPCQFLQWLSSNIGVTLKQNQNIIKPKQSIQQLTKRIEVSSLIYSQNQEYEIMAKQFQLKREKSKARKQSIQLFQQNIQKLKQKFSEEPTHETGITIQVRFRLPFSGKSIMRNFQLKDKVNEMFDYIHCFGRDEFEQLMAQFDLTQTFPKLSLVDKKESLIQDIFADSQRQNIIVKQL